MAGVIEQEIQDEQGTEGLEKIVDKRDGEKKPLYKRPAFVLAFGIALIIGGVVGLRYWLYARSHESTDDAFVEGHIVQVSSKVSGHIVKLYVTDNQEVKEGDLIAEIDPRDYQARLEQAKAALEAAQARARSGARREINARHYARRDATSDGHRAACAHRCRDQPRSGEG